MPAIEYYIFILVPWLVTTSISVECVSLWQHTPVFQIRNVRNSFVLSIFLKARIHQVNVPYIFAKKGNITQTCLCSMQKF